MKGRPGSKENRNDMKYEESKNKHLEHDDNYISQCWLAIVEWLLEELVHLLYWVESSDIQRSRSLTWDQEYYWLVVTQTRFYQDGLSHHQAQMQWKGKLELKVSAMGEFSDLAHINIK